MADQAIASTEEMVGSGHATKADTLNRLTLVEHHTDGGHECDNVTPHFYAADAEVSDTYAITLSPAATAYNTGMLVAFKANTINTGACTLNVNSLGAKAIKRDANVDPANGDIAAGQIILLGYDGTNFQMLTHPQAIPSGTKMIFKQAAAPTGWTADDTITANSMVVYRRTTGYGADGGSVDPTALSTGQIDLVHVSYTGNTTDSYVCSQNESLQTVSATDGALPRVRDYASSITISPKYTDVICATKD